MAARVCRARRRAEPIRPRKVSRKLGETHRVTFGSVIGAEAKRRRLATTRAGAAARTGGELAFRRAC